MKIRINKEKREEYSHIEKPGRLFTVTSKSRTKYFIRSGGIDNLYDVNKKDCTVVEK